MQLTKPCRFTARITDYKIWCFDFWTGTAVDGADLKLAFAALTTALLEAAKLDKDELSLRYFYVKVVLQHTFLFQQTNGLCTRITKL